VSSSFFVRREPPGDAAAVIKAIDRPGLRWVDGELDELVGPWPPGVVLLWIPGGSTRGVEITYAEGRMCVRLLAMSSREDYDLAFRLVEVLGGDGEVEPEEGEPVPAARVREHFDAAWIEHNIATGAAGIGAALARGKRVTVSGPITSVRIDPVQPFDAAAFLESMRTAQVTAAADDGGDDDGAPTPWEEIEDSDLLAGEQEHQAELQARDGRLAPLAATRRASARRGWGLLFPVVLAVVLLPALLVRLVTLPFRHALRRRRDERRAERDRRERETCRDEVVRETARLAEDPDDLAARRRRADRLRRLGHLAAAERDLAACVDRLADAAPERAAVLAEHAVVLRQLGCRNLADAAEQAALADGARVVPVGTARLAGVGAGGLFLLIAGLADD
jgi:hypothetical protein